MPYQLVDAKAIAKRHHDVSVLYDVRRGCVAEVTDEWRKASMLTLCAGLTDALRHTVQAVYMAMREPTPRPPPWNCPRAPESSSLSASMSCSAPTRHWMPCASTKPARWHHRATPRTRTRGGRGCMRRRACRANVRPTSRRSRRPACAPTVPGLGRDCCASLEPSARSKRRRPTSKPSKAMCAKTSRIRCSTSHGRST